MLTHKGMQGKKKGGQRTELWSRAVFRDPEREKSVETRRKNQDANSRTQGLG